MTVIQVSNKEYDDCACYPTPGAADIFCSPVPRVEKQFFPIHSAFPPSTSVVEFSLGAVVEEQFYPDPDVVSPRTEFSLGGPQVENRPTSFQVVEEEGRQPETSRGDGRAGEASQ